MFDESLLNDAYNIMSKKMLNIVRKNHFINFVIDDSNNINQNRIINLFCNINDIFYYFCNENISDVKHEIDVLISWLNEKMRFYSNENFSKINFYVIDIESKMKNINVLFNVQKKFKHIFWMFCDSHEFQFLMKNIFELFWFKNVFKKIVEIVIYFHKSNKQFDYLKICQKQRYNRHFSIMLSVLTHWNTQIRIFSLFDFQLIRTNRLFLIFYSQ